MQAVNLIETARDAGVEQFVHTSVSGAGRHTEAPGWAEGRWAAMEQVYKPKTGAEAAVRAGQPARPEFARALGIPLTPFADWAREHLGATPAAPAPRG